MTFAAAEQTASAGPLRAAWRETAPIHLVLVPYVLAGVATSALLGIPIETGILPYAAMLGMIGPLALIAFALMILLRLIIVERPARPLLRFTEEIGALLQGPRLARALLLLLSLAALQTMYTFFKGLIPVLRPFSWDETFMLADRALFLGRDGWEVLWPIFGHPLATSALNFVYHLWFFWMVFAWIFLAFSLRNRAAGTQFFLAFVLSWSVGGTVLALLFSSAGPCYYGFVADGLNPFAEQLRRLDALHEVLPVMARDVQAMLWASYSDPALGEPAGISAMPSMHCTTAMLLTLVAYAHNRVAGHVSAVVTGLILIGSVHLAWHYAVDGIAGMLMAWALWRLSGHMLAWWRQVHPA